MKKLKKTLFNPFEKIAGTKALITGIALIIVTGIAGYFAKVNFDGILDVHFLQKELSLITHIAEGLINWLSLSVILLIAGLVFSKTKFRVVDVLGTQALARYPMLIVSILALLPVPHQKISLYLQWRLMGTGEEIIPGTGEIIVFALFMIITLAMTIWMVILMYRAYSISCNIKGTKGVISFIVSLIVAETISKYIFYSIYSMNI